MTAYDYDYDGPVCERCGGYLVRLWCPYRMACESCEIEDEGWQRAIDNSPPCQYCGETDRCKCYGYLV